MNEEQKSKYKKISDFIENDWDTASKEELKGAKRLLYLLVTNQIEDSSMPSLEILNAVRAGFYYAQGELLENDEAKQALEEFIKL